jgi:hypothetical protein
MQRQATTAGVSEGSLIESCPHRHPAFIAGPVVEEEQLLKNNNRSLREYIASGKTAALHRGKLAGLVNPLRFPTRYF